MAKTSNKSIILISGLTGVLLLLGGWAVLGAARQSKEIGTCSKPGDVRQLVIENNQFKPESLTVDRCDQVQITNKDSRVRLPALGEHDSHAAYPGFAEKVLGQGQSNTFVASKTGTYHIHDHNDDEVAGQITVK